jgi:hypothetical protein
VSPTKPESGAAAGSLEAQSGLHVAVSAQVVYPKYFETLGIAMVAGRDFDSGDLGEKSHPVCVVNESFACLAFHGENPMGKPCRTMGNPQRTVEIVGVVKDSRYTNLKGMTQPVVYQPFLQADTIRGQMILHVRVEGPSESVAARVREEVATPDRVACVATLIIENARKQVAI